jgi:glycosyltransferase involved in cell wall biosynthesis
MPELLHGILPSPLGRRGEGHRPEAALKVCIASLAPFVGGAEVAAERLAVGLQEAGHEVFLLLGQEGDVLDRCAKAGLRCQVAPMQFTDFWHPWRYFGSLRRLRRILRQERPDLVHANDLPVHQIVSAAARWLGMPRICHHRFPYDGDTIDWFNKFGAERHLFVSRALMEEMCAESPALRLASRAVVYDGLPLPPVPGEEDRLGARRRLGHASDRVVVTFAGQFIERKGVAELLRAWGTLLPQEAAVAELVLVGDDSLGRGAYRVEMEKLASYLGILPRFVGFQKNVGDWLLASDVAVVPSHVEPLGNATLEAMAYALPVIGSRVGGIPEMIVHEETGLLVAPRSPEDLAAAIRRLIANPELRQTLGANGRRRCEEKFSLTAHVASVLKEYRAITHVASN